MKSIFAKMGRAKYIVSALLAVAAVALPVAVIASFGPDRPTKAYVQGMRGFEYPVFNSITGVPGYGDERAFFTGAYPGGGSLTDPLAEVQQGDELVLQVLVHNNADPSLNDAPGQPGVALNTRVKIALPTGSTKNAQARAEISASNTNPLMVFDTLDFSGKNGESFELEYVRGSANVRGNNINMALPDDIVAGGTLVGSNVLDGKVKGCFGEEVLVTIKVKVKMPNYTIAKKVRFAGQGAADWKKSITAKPGDKVEWTVNFRNIGATQLKNVAMVDEVPAGITVVPSTIVQYDGNFPNGYTHSNTAIQANGRQININQGNHNPLAQSDINGGLLSTQVIFATTVDQLSATECGVKKLTNKAFITPEGYGSIFDTAEVLVDSGKTCVETPPIYDCTDLAITALGGRKYRFTVSTTAANGATVKDYNFNYGDTVTELKTSNTADHEYTKDGAFVAKVTVRFNTPTGEKSVDGVNCVKTVNVKVDENCPIVGKGHLPKNSPECKDTPVVTTVIPDTGTGNMIGLFAAVSAFSTMAYRFVVIRRFN